MRKRALRYLRVALDKLDAEFRPGQWESIESLFNRRRLLLVERTGWGKSMVYFLATRLLRDKGVGPSLLISPLLSLMRNQIEAAARIGLRAESINSSNTDYWGKTEQELQNNAIDILLISPERLANEHFHTKVLSKLAVKVGLFVVDEAHCISDWGHDFRPDYRRIVRIIKALPRNVAVLATTATANDRVVKDILTQIGDNIELVRGPLVRKSLKLQNISLPSPAARMAWLAEMIPSLPKSGIIYTLTKRDAERVAQWLRLNEISAAAYHAGLNNPDDGPPLREQLEQQLINNEIKTLVATVALGMGFDKPDLGFVIHFQRPASVVHYYQQVGRAGRAISEAYGILMHGEEDDRISDYFFRHAFPPQKHVKAILSVLDNAETGLSIPNLEKSLNLRKKDLEKSLKYLSLESPAPVTKIGSKWNATAAAVAYRIDKQHIDSITSIRREEQAEMDRYMAHRECLMEFLGKALDDPDARPCGKCQSCKGEPLLKNGFDHDLANRAGIFLKRSYQSLLPRKIWPVKGSLKSYKFSGLIGDALKAEEGRALCLWRDAGWGQLVAAGKYETNLFDDELVTACVDMLHKWNPEIEPLWVTCIPSLKHRELVPDFASRLAIALGLPFSTTLLKTIDNPQQKKMQNSYQQAKNLDGIFTVIEENMRKGPCLLVDDLVDSRWTFTVAAALLRKAGCEAVIPLALALNSP